MIACNLLAFYMQLHVFLLHVFACFVCVICVQCACNLWELHAPDACVMLQYT